MFDSVLLITVLVIRGLAVVGAVLRARRRDICLKSFSGYLVYLRMKDGKQVWGQLRSEATGIELSYRQDHFDNDGHIESSYVVFKSETRTSTCPCGSRTSSQSAMRGVVRGP